MPWRSQALLIFFCVCFLFSKADTSDVAAGSGDGAPGCLASSRQEQECGAAWAEEQEGVSQLQTFPGWHKKCRSDSQTPEEWTQHCTEALWRIYFDFYEPCLAKATSCLSYIKAGVKAGCGCSPLLAPFVSGFTRAEKCAAGLTHLKCPKVSTVARRGCQGMTDAEVLAGRVGLFLNETRAFTTIGEPIDATLVAAAREDASLYWPMVGRYQGYDAMIEYISVGDWILNDGWFQPRKFQAGTVVPSVSAEHWWLNGTLQFSFFGDLDDTEWQPVINELTYAETCDVRYIKHYYDLAPTAEGRIPFNERMAATGMSYHGLPYICNTLSQNCVGAQQQFANFTDCARYFATLDVTDPMCAVKGQFGMGASQRCKLIHLFMTKPSPELHCWHAGPTYEADAKGVKHCYPEECVD